MPVESVSYTNLDVYKGQMDNRRAVDLSTYSAQVLQLCERAGDYLAARPGGAETLADLDAGRNTGSSLMERMAGARTAHEVFGAMQTDPGHVVSELQRLSVGMPRERGPLPGGLTIETPEAMRGQLAGMGAEDRERLMDLSLIHI